jgi:hypothetical protein
MACLIPDFHLLLLVYLTFVDELFERTGPEKPIHRDIAALPKPKGAILGLQVVRGVFNR